MQRQSRCFARKPMIPTVGWPKKPSKCRWRFDLSFPGRIRSSLSGLGLMETLIYDCVDGAKKRWIPSYCEGHGKKRKRVRQPSETSLLGVTSKAIIVWEQTAARPVTGHFQIRWLYKSWPGLFDIRIFKRKTLALVRFVLPVTKTHSGLQIVLWQWKKTTGVVCQLSSWYRLVVSGLEHRRSNLCNCVAKGTVTLSNQFESIWRNLALKFLNPSARFVSLLCDYFCRRFNMTVKRRNHGRNKKGRGHVKRVRCVSTGKAIPKDKAIKRFIVRNIVDASSLRDIKEASAYSEYQLPKLYLKMYYCVEAAVHQRIVRGRSKVGRRIRTPPPRFQRKN